MNNILFLYNIVLTVFFTIALTSSCIMYMKSRKREFFLLGLLYLLLIIDNSIIYISEFSKSFEVLYQNTNMIYVVIYLTYLGIIFTTRFVIAERFMDKFTIVEQWIFIVLPIFLGILCFIAPHHISEGLIYVSFFGTFAYIAFRVFKNTKTLILDDKIRKVYILFTWSIIILCIFALIDSTCYYLTFFAKTFDYRNIFFDIIKLFIGAIGINYLYGSFQQLFDKKSVDEHLAEFCIKNALTNRQKEIIGLIIDGYTNKEIGDTLNITEGTVKAHITNIFKKTDVSNRNQIVKRILNN